MADGSRPPGLSLSADIAEAVAAAEGKSAQLRNHSVSLFRVHKAYRRVFVTPGAATATDQAIVLRDIMARSGLGRASMTLDPQELAELEGARRVGLHIFGRLKLDDSRLRQLELDLRNIEEEED
ncbi:MAG: hypothetical protein CL802_13510 [Citromicrobium sp.]|nr:hypothetical protein [Citromicrobium sp.]|tara:strand:- start:25535 stop:25906 length:372 start_codon:yes stop_codon:yes gene_type:complete